MRVIARRRALLIAMLALVTVVMGAPKAAHAAQLRAPTAAMHKEYRIGGTTLYIGVVAQDGAGGNYYCMEAGAPLAYEIGKVTRIDDSEHARRIAWLLERYRGASDPSIHAAIGVLVHDRFDRDPAVWHRHRDAIIAAHPDVGPRAEALWKESGDRTPRKATVAQRYAQGLRRGEVEISIRNASGAVVEGVPYTVEIHGPARFDGQRSTISSVSTSAAVTHAWTATGHGRVNVSVSYEYGRLSQADSSQDLLFSAGPSAVEGNAMTFDVRKDFSPTLSTSVQSPTVDAGDHVIDRVTSGLSGEDSFWVPGLDLRAKGWYFEGLKANDLHGGIDPKEKEGAADFIERLGSQGYRPAAYGSAVFSAPGQTREVTATVAPSGREPYRSTDSGGFGTWVWAFAHSELSDQAKEYVLHDVVSPFLERAETNSGRSRLTVRSSVTEHSALVGAELSDTITVSGFPADHPSFTGDPDYGFGADRPYAQVSVWWSGDRHDPGNDGKYRPHGAATPREDANHERIGTWDYAARNGTVRVGAGAPDAHGAPVSIVARTHGWYVFVWEFGGDDRVMPHSSSYDDAWERTRAELVAPGRVPSVATQVDHDRVAVGEPFRDRATVTGDLDRGSYVEFSAHGPVDSGADPSSGGLVLHAARVRLDHTVSAQTVVSPVVRSSAEGLVYWKATVFSSSGDVLATHDLGAEGEVVEVAPRSPGPPQRPALAATGSRVALAVGCSVFALVTGVLMYAGIRRRSR